MGTNDKGSREAPDCKTPEWRYEMASITYVGHSCFEITLGDQVILTDPWMNPRPREVNRLVAPAFPATHLKKVDAIFVSHYAFDHCDNYDITTLVNRTFASVIAPDEALANLTIPDRNKVAASEGDRFHLYGLDVEVLPARSTQMRESVGYIISAGGKRVYFSGDTYDFPGFSQVNADVGIIPIGGTYTMDILSAVTAAKKMRVRKVIPCHYNTFDRIKADPYDFEKRVKADGRTEPIVMSVGQTIDF